MTAPTQHTALVLKSEAAPTQYGAVIKGTFTIALTFEHTTNGLNHIEAQIETAGQECSRLVQHVQPRLAKNGKALFFSPRCVFWLASTRVEKWNALAAAAERCKHNGMSGTAQGVLAAALYAAKNGHTNT